MKIYDCFIFFNEFELLELRLNELDSVVDKFVLVEATRTHQNKEKPLYFNENKKRFDKFKDKIIHIIVDQYPENIISPWCLENHQRNKIMDGLIDCKPDDLIIISDLDEIPKLEKIKEIINNRDTEGIKIFSGRLFYYFLNFAQKKGFWSGSAMIKYKYLTLISPQILRSVCFYWNGSLNYFLIIGCLKDIFLNLRKGLKAIKKRPSVKVIKGLIHRLKDTFLARKSVIMLMYRLKERSEGPPIKVIEDSLWHFSCLGGTQRIIEKIEATAHEEYNTNEFKSKKRIEEAINSGKSIFRDSIEFEAVPIDETFPKYLRDNLDRFSHLIKIIKKSQNF